MVLPRKIKRLAEEYRRGIAAALGVSPEEIRPEVVEKWAEEWARAMLVPEAFRRIFGHYSPTRVEEATRVMFMELKKFLPAKGEREGEVRAARLSF